MPMRTKEEMYDFAAQRNLAGIPALLYPMSWLGRMNFKVVEENLGFQELAVFSFMAIANPNDFDNRGSNGINGSNNNSPSQNPSNKINRKWMAFALTNKGNLYYGHWRLFGEDSGNVPIRSEQDLSLNLNRHFSFYHSVLDIDTLRKSLPNLNQSYDHLRIIRNSISATIGSLGSHANSDDGRRVYDQAMGTYNDDDPRKEDDL